MKKSTDNFAKPVKNDYIRIKLVEFMKSIYILMSRGNQRINYPLGQELFSVPTPCTCSKCEPQPNRMESKIQTVMKQDRSGGNPYSMGNVSGRKLKARGRNESRLVDTRFMKTAAFPVLWCMLAHQESREHLKPLAE